MALALPPRVGDGSVTDDKPYCLKPVRVLLEKEIRNVATLNHKNYSNHKLHAIANTQGKNMKQYVVSFDSRRL